MARQVTRTIVAAFRKGKAAKCGNTECTGKAIFLHGNKIAENREGVCWVTDATWPTRTTHERLRALGLSVGLYRGEQRIYGTGEGAIKNGEYWNGEWIATEFKFEGVSDVA